MGTLPVAIPTTKKSPIVGALVIFFIIWALWTLDLHSVRIVMNQAVSNTPSDPYSDTAGDTIKLELETLSGDGSVVIDTEIGSRPEVSVATSITLIEPLLPGVGGAEQTHPNLIDRPLILYAYSETKSARINLEFFIAHGLHAAADFVFILNGKSNAASIIPVADNIRFVQRSNDCYDLGAYAEVLTTNNLYKSYSKFIMLNASIRGPFLPYWAESCWSDMYLGKITDEVKLVGMTANCWPSFHVQSMIWATDSIGISILLFPTEAATRDLKTYDAGLKMLINKTPQNPGINSCFHTWGQAVSAEIGASDIIRAAGYKLDTMMAAHHADEKYEKNCDASKNGDVLFDKGYYGTNVHPYETIFIKSNRDIDPIGLERLTEWTRGRGYSSYHYCKI